MKAIVAHGPNNYALEDMPLPAVPAGWARVKVKMAAFCATDLDVLSGEIAAKYPITPGHEWCGVVDEANGGDAAWVGKRVAGSNDVCCLACQACRAGLWRNCASFGEIGFAYNGAFAEYLLVPQYALRELPESVSDVQAALLEPLGVALGTLKKAELSLGDSALVLGAGSIGLNVLAVARASGALNITVLDRCDDRLDIARKMGADNTVNSGKSDALAELARIYPQGPDVIIDCTGSEECVRLALSLAPKLGRVALAGYGRGRDMSIHFDDIHVKDLRVVGAGNNWNVVDLAISLTATGRVNTEALATHFFRLGDFAEAARMASARTPGFVKAIFEL